MSSQSRSSTTHSPAGSTTGTSLVRGLGSGRKLAEGMSHYGIVLVLVVLVAGISIKQPSFIHGDSLGNLAQQWAPVGLMAIGGTFVIIAGGFDFSVGGVYALSATLSAGFTQDMPLGFAYVVVIAIGAGCGLVNGLVVTRLKVNPFIATIGSGQVYRGLALLYSAGAPIIVGGTAFGFVGHGDVLGLPVSGLILFAAFVVSGFVLARSIFGRNVYLVGDNSEAARLTGVRVDRLLTATYVLSGVTAAVAGMLYSSRLGIGQADVGVGIELSVVIAIVIGGTAIGGGTGAMWRTFIGLAILATMQNGFDALNISSNLQTVLVGLILVAAVAGDEFSKRRQSRPAYAPEVPAVDDEVKGT